MHHPAQLDLVASVSVDAEKPDQTTFGDPEKVVELFGRSRPERLPLELQAPAVDGDASRGEILDLAEILRSEPSIRAKPAGRTFQPGAFGLCSSFGSLGSPSTRSATMFRWIWAVPPQIVSDLEKKKLV